MSSFGYLLLVSLSVRKRSTSFASYDEEPKNTPLEMSTWEGKQQWRNNDESNSISDVCWGVRDAGVTTG